MTALFDRWVQWYQRPSTVNRPWCIFGHKLLATERPKTTARARSRRLPQQSPVAVSVDDGGAHGFEILRSLHGNHQRIIQLREQKERCHKEQMVAQGQIDYYRTVLLRMESDSRTEYDYTADAYKAEIERLEKNIPKLQETLSNLAAELDQALLDRNTTWLQMYGASQPYFEACFKAKFEKRWCLFFHECVLLRASADIHSHLQDKEQILRQQRLKLSRARISLWKATKQLNKGTQRLSHATQAELETARRQHFEAEKTKHEREIAKLQKILKDGRESHEEKKKNFIETHIGPLLQHAEKVAQDDDTEGGDTEAPTDHDAQQLDFSDSSTSDQSDASLEIPEDVPDLQELYNSIAGALDAQQAVLSAKLGSVEQWHLTYLSTPLAKVDRMVDITTKDDRKQIRKSERRLVLVANRLRQLGGSPLSATSVRTEREITGGGLHHASSRSSRSSRRSRAQATPEKKISHGASRRRINKFRFSITRPARPSVTPSSPGDRDLSNIPNSIPSSPSI